MTRNDAKGKWLGLMNAIFRAAFDLRPIDGNLKLKCEDSRAHHLASNSLFFFQGRVGRRLEGFFMI